MPNKSRTCPVCNLVRRMNGRICQNCYNQYKSIKNKEKYIEYKGGCCQKCGYNKSNSALVFHHLNPEKKEFGIASSKKSSWNKTKKELDKCLLLCQNCHMEEHEQSFLDREKFIQKFEHAWNNAPKIQNREINKKARPPKEELEKLIGKKTLVEIGNIYGVSDSIVSRWAKIYEIEKPKRGY